MKKAILLKDNLPGFVGHAGVYELKPPFLKHRFVVVSAVATMFSGPETLIFPSTRKGKVTSYKELPGSYRGGLSHKQALNNMGYSI